jgi:CRP-like cAMP-binding protein
MNDAFLELFSFDITPYVTTMTFQGDAAITTEGEPIHHLYYLEKGTTKLMATHENGRVSLVTFFHAPCFFGEMELLRDDSITRTMIAVLPCTCYAIDTSLCKDKLLADPRFLRALCIQTSQRLESSTGFLLRSLAYPLKNRLATLILLTSPDGYYRMRHTEASEYLGVTYRHLLYVLAEFTADGLLSKTKQGYRIENRVALERLAIESESG